MCLTRLCSQRHGHLHAGAPADDPEGDASARLEAGNRFGEVGEVLDGAAVDGDDDVAADGQGLAVDRGGRGSAAQAGLGGRRAGPDEPDQDAAVDGQVDRPGEAGVSSTPAMPR